jgi:hypothetical protein
MLEHAQQQFRCGVRAMTKRKPVEVVEEGLKPFVGKLWNSGQPVQIRVLDQRGLQVVGIYSATAADIPKLMSEISKAQGDKCSLHHLVALKNSM